MCFLRAVLATSGGLPRAQPRGSSLLLWMWCSSWDLRGEARSGCWGGLVSGGDGTERPGQRDTPAAAAALRFRAGQGLAIAGTAERSGWPSSSPAASPGGRC